MAVAPRVEAGRALEWLLASDEPAVVALARRDLLDEDVRPGLGELLRGRLVVGLLAGQLPDGGFGVHPYRKWGGAHWRLVSLVELGVPAGEPRLVAASLEHALFRSLSTGEPIHPSWLVAHYPPFWHYDVPQALLILSRLRRVPDPRAEEALDLLVGLRRRDGLWQTGGRWWRPPGSSGANVEVVDWGRGAIPMVTLNALRILRAAGRLEAA